MAGKSPVTASDEQRGGLLAFADSRDRGEADRARAVLLTLAGWTSSKIAEAFGVREDTVRLWRSDFTASGVAALKTSIAPGPPPVKSEAALRVVTPLLEEPVADRRNWTIPRLRADAAQTSTLFAGTHARGGANSFLWISEWGFVQCEDLRRSEEILTGAIPSAKDGTIVVETTWRGGRGGHLWDIVKKALETPEEQKQPDDWRVVFFPWQIDNAYCDPEPQALSEETLRYFSDKPGFSLGQMSWYQRARAQYGMLIKREFPTVLEECFQTPIEGAIYAEIIDRLRAEGAIRPAVVDTSSLVHTTWDLGSPLNTVVTYFQLVGSEIRPWISSSSPVNVWPATTTQVVFSSTYLSRYSAVRR
jgi:transposase